MVESSEGSAALSICVVTYSVLDQTALGKITLPFETSHIHVPVVPHKAVAEVSKIGNL
jgi:hypothetical protein